MPKFEVGDQLISKGYSFTVGKIEEDFDTGEPIYEEAPNAKDPLYIEGFTPLECFKESECRRTRKAKKNV